MPDVGYIVVKIYVGFGVIGGIVIAWLCFVYLKGSFKWMIKGSWEEFASLL